MFTKVKYIITEEGDIIVFPMAIEHARFKNFNPVSAGFISFGINKNGNPDCTCYGESYSLNLESREIDTEIAKRQLNMSDPYL